MNLSSRRSINIPARISWFMLILRGNLLHIYYMININVLYSKAKLKNFQGTSEIFVSELHFILSDKI